MELNINKKYIHSIDDFIKILIEENNDLDVHKPDEKIIYECCKLAKKYSNASNDTKAGVIYTKRKYLRKPPKANLGYVTYKNEQEIIVDDNK